MQNGTLNLVGCTIETADSQKGVGLKLLWSKEVTVNLTDCLVRASVPIEVENSADCTLNLQDCILESCYSGTPETKPEHIVHSGSTRITCNLTDTVQR